MKLSTFFLLGFAVILSGIPVSTFAQPIGQVDTAGTTWYDFQHTGSCQRMIAVDPMGYAHVAWLNGLGDESRHVFYNAWDPTSQAFSYSPGGCQVDAGTRGGTVTLDCKSTGIATPAYHELFVGNTRTTIACDFFQHVCAFTGNSENVAALWPHLSVDILDRSHVLAVPEAAPVFPFPLRYVRMEGGCEEGGGEWQYPLIMDSIATLAHTLATSRHTERIAAGWTHPRGEGEMDNDAMIRISDDGGVTWGPNTNITNFVASYPGCCDTATHPATCAQDTFRLYTDMSLLFDEQDALHAVFTARTWYDASVCGADPYGWISQSGIWHWSESTQNFSLIASAFYFETINDGTIIDNGIWQTNVQRPSLAIDTTNGYLYCSYMQYDSNCYSSDGYPMADIFVSVSTNNGESWSVGTNVTRTCPGENIPAPGSMHERDQTLAEGVTSGMIHLFYELDHDAGSQVLGEGTVTLNEMLYQRVPVDSIAATPLVPNLPLHADSTGFDVSAPRAPTPAADAIILHPTYPNPFNSSAVVSFSLPKRMTVELHVYDLLGRQTAVLASGIMAAGRHEFTWNAASLPSGLYFLTLRSASETHIQKLMLLR